MRPKLPNNEQPFLLDCLFELPPHQRLKTLHHIWTTTTARLRYRLLYLLLTHHRMAHPTRYRTHSLHTEPIACPQHQR